MTSEVSKEAAKCWVIGLGRTGTNTMCQALRLLGYGRVKHNPTFEELASLDAGADNGVIMHYKYLDYKFPGSKFVLTKRDLPDWLVSMEYIANRHPVVSRDADLQILRRMTVYESVVFERDTFIAAYHRHHEDVRRYFRHRPDDLLEMNIFAGEQWTPLCGFLNRPVPPDPFPFLHQRDPSPAPSSDVGSQV